MNVLLIGHACGPDVGSEPGFTWNWAQSLSAIHRVWVVAHPERRASVEKYLAHSPNSNLRFVWVNTDHPLDPWKPERGERGIRIHYMLWLPKAYRRALEVCREVQIDVAQHVSWGTISASPPLWRLPVPTVWGPIGGGQTTDPRYLGFFGRQHWVERIRTVRVKALRLSRSLRRAVRGSDLIFATNRETAELLKQVGTTPVEMLLDGGIPPAYLPEYLPAAVTASGRFTLMWAGRLEYRKGLALALYALARVTDASVTLVVAGRGPQQEELQSFAHKLGIAHRVSFLGSVPYDQMKALFQGASAFLFTSLRDSFGSVVLEAMAHSLPVVTFDHQGVGAFVPEEAAIKVKISEPDQTISDLAAAIRDLAAASPEVLEKMRLASWRFAQEQTWEHRAMEMSNVYEKIVNSKNGYAVGR